MIGKVNIYIDESGNTDIDILKDGASKYYALTAVVIPTKNVSKVESELYRMTQGNEIKSSKIRSARRAKWIQKISRLDFSYHVLIVDKSKINRSSGLVHKKSFFKFFSRKMYERLHRVHDVINFIADDYGTKEFMKECDTYYRSNVSNPMFEYINIPGSKRKTFMRVDSKESMLVQLADLICGTTLRVVEGKDAPSVLEPITNMRLACTIWPPARRIAGMVKSGEDLDDLVQAVSFSETIKFIDNSFNSVDELEVLASIVLTYLLDKYLENSESYHNSIEIRGYLLNVEGFNINDYRFKQIVGYIRTAGVPIASSGTGYKIPNDGSDIENFVRKVQSTVDPYVQRLGHVRSLLYQASNGKWDILSDESLAPLKRYLD